MSVYAKWRAWQQRNPHVVDRKYAVLYARLTRSPAACRAWSGR